MSTSDVIQEDIFILNLLIFVFILFIYLSNMLKNHRAKIFAKPSNLSTIVNKFVATSVQHFRFVLSTLV